MKTIDGRQRLNHALALLCPNENVGLDSGTLSHEKINGSGAIRLNVLHQAYFYKSLELLGSLRIGD
jgi:hypothetical protein